MQHYLLQFDSTTSTMPRFEYQFEMASNGMAKDYSARVLKLFAPGDQVSSFVLWQLTSPTSRDDAKLVARIELVRPETRITEERM